MVRSQRACLSFREWLHIAQCPPVHLRCSTWQSSQLILNAVPLSLTTASSSSRHCPYILSSQTLAVVNSAGWTWSVGIFPRRRFISLGYVSLERGILKHSVFNLLRLSLLFSLMTVEFHTPSKVNGSSFSRLLALCLYDDRHCNIHEGFPTVCDFYLLTTSNGEELKYAHYKLKSRDWMLVAKDDGRNAGKRVWRFWYRLSPETWCADHDWLLWLQLALPT